MSQLAKLLSASLAITVFVLRISGKVLLLKFCNTRQVLVLTQGDHSFLSRGNMVIFLICSCLH